MQLTLNYNIIVQYKYWSFCQCMTLNYNLKNIDECGLIYYKYNDSFMVIIMAHGI